MRGSRWLLAREANSWQTALHSVLREDSPPVIIYDTPSCMNKMVCRNTGSLHHRRSPSSACPRHAARTRMLCHRRSTVTCLVSSQPFCRGYCLPGILCAEGTQTDTKQFFSRKALSAKPLPGHDCTCVNQTSDCSTGGSPYPGTQGGCHLLKAQAQLEAGMDPRVN